MSSYWIGNEVGNLQSSHIFGFPPEIKSRHPISHPLWCNPIGAFLEQLLIIVHQVLVLPFSSFFNNGFDCPISFRALVVGMKNGTFKDKRKRLAINIVKFAELANIRFFQDGTTDYNINVLLPQQSIDGFVKPLFHIKVEKNLKTVLALANVTGMEDDFLVAPKLFFQRLHFFFKNSDFVVSNNNST